MAVSSTSSSTSNWASMFGIKNNGIGGLATGLDTDSLVEALTSGTRAKIAKQGQDKQILNWKMTSYRSMSSALKAFQTKSFSYQSNTNTNLLSSSFFNTYKTSSSSSKVSVATGSSTALGSFTIDAVQQLATAETVTSGTKLSTDLLLGGLTDGQNVGANAFSGQTLKLDYNGTVKTVKLDDLNQFIDNGNLKLDDNFKNGLQTLLDNAFSKKTVYTDVYNEETKLYDKVASKVSNVQVSIVGGKIKLDSDSAKLTIAADNDLLGVSEADSSRVSTKTKIGAISAFANVQGDVLTFNINGTEISVNKNESLDTLMTRINTSAAGVRMSYSSNTDQFTMTSKATGGGENIVMSDVQGNLMNEIFGVKGGSGIGTNRLTTDADAVSQNAGRFYDTEAGAMFANGSSELRSLGSSLKNMMFDMTINGVTKTVKVDTTVIGGTEDNIDPFGKGNFTVDEMYQAINKGITNAFGSDAGVSLYNAGNGKTGISTGYGVAASIDGGGIMDVLGFDGKTGNTVIDLDYGSKIEASNAISYTLATGTTGTMSMTINGVTKQLEVNGFNIMSGDSALNSAISKAFGADIAKSVKFTAEYTRGPETAAKDENDDPLLDDEGNPIMLPGAITGMKLTLNVSDPSMAVAIGKGTTQNGKVDLFNEIGFSGASLNNDNPTNNSITFGQLSGGTALAAGTNTLTIKYGTGTGESFTVDYSSGTKIQDFIAQINTRSNGNVSAAIVDGQLKITSKTGTIDIKDSVEATIVDGETVDKSLLKNMFGIDGSQYKTAAEGTVSRTEGKNAEIVVDGVVISRASNTIEVNGVNVTVNQVTEAGEAPIKIDVTSDPTDVIKRIQDWMDDYNALIYTLNSAINESKNGDYTPLTDDQKSKMTEDQVKTWESEAKKGLLRNDSTLRQILGDLRASLYEKVESVGLSLYDLGITTKKYSAPNEAGQIEFADSSSSANGLSGQDKLRKLLESEPDKVRMFFQDANQGLAVKMNNIIDKAANPSSVNRGSLVRLAGTEISTGDNTSTLGNKISAIDKYIASLKNRMESEYNRYWKKFSALEVAVQKMSSQSSWLTQS